MCRTFCLPSQYEISENLILIVKRHSFVKILLSVFIFYLFVEDIIRWFDMDPG